MRHFAGVFIRVDKSLFGPTTNTNDKKRPLKNLARQIDNKDVHSHTRQLHCLGEKSTLHEIRAEPCQRLSRFMAKA